MIDLRKEDKSLEVKGLLEDECTNYINTNIRKCTNYTIANIRKCTNYIITNIRNIRIISFRIYIFKN